MVDLVIWPWFERMEMFKVLYGDDFRIPEKKLPNLVSSVTFENTFYRFITSYYGRILGYLTNIGKISPIM